MNSTGRIDVQQVKSAGAGRELELIEYVAHIDRELLDGRHHPCPKCGGTDRFRCDRQKGFVICNQCFNSKNGDFLSAIQHFRGIDFRQALEESAYRLGIVHSLGGANGNGKPATISTAAGQGGKPDPLIRMAQTKRCPVESLRAYGGTAFPEQAAVVFPMFDGNGKKISQFNIWPDHRDELQRKGLNATGKPTGMFLPVVDEQARKPQPGETWLVLEGVKDAAAAHGMGLQAVGLPGKSIKQEWRELFRGVNALVCLDNDDAGRKAAPKAAKDLQGAAASVRIVSLPHPGDLRDNLALDGGEQAVRQAIETAGQEGEPPAFTKILTSLELLDLDLSAKFHVRGILAQGQHGVIGGRSKTLKTSIAIDLVVSLGTGSPFLGEYPTEQCIVGIWTGESGGFVVRETASRVAAARGVDLRASSIFWSFTLPKLFQAEHLDCLEKLIVERQLGVIFIDPLYLCLLSAEMAGHASSVYAMGSLLEPIGMIGQRTGCTIILLHHFRKGPGPDADEPCSLEQLSQSGVAEWARQWLLLERRTPYASDGHHELYLRAGGSAGHGALLGVNVDEGIFDPDNPTGGRRWDVSVRPVSDVREERKKASEQRKIAQREQRDNDDRRKMLEAVRRCPDGETQKELSRLCGLSGERGATAIRTLLGEGRIKKVEFKKYTRMETGYMALE